MFLRLRCSSGLCALLFACLFAAASTAQAQQQAWFRTGTGLGGEKPRVAVADFTPRADPAKPHSTLFSQVVRDDLSFSGILDVVSPSFYPQSQPSVPSELRFVAWSDSPVNAHFVAFGNTNLPTKSSCGFPGGCPASHLHKSRLSVRAPAPRKSGPWITMARISIR